jgi:CHAD domain-containing protein
MAKAQEITGLDGSAGALESAVKVLKMRFEEIAELYRTSSNFSDVDSIHDLRVAARRLRSALRDFMPLLEKESFREIKKELKKMADALGKVRDEDVAIEALEKLQAEAESEAIKKQIGVFWQERKDARELAGAKLAEYFTRERTDKLQEALATKLEKNLSLKELPETTSFKEFGKEVIKKNLQEFETLSPSLYEPFDSDKLHRLRIHAKRLRYAMKVFATCWDEDCRQFAKKVSKMQTFLGDLHDCDEWIEKLFSRLREGGEPLDQNRREALIWLLARFFEERNKHYLGALKLWSDWQADYFLPRLKAMTL